MCIRDKSNDRATCDDKKTSCYSSAKTASATATGSATGSTTIAPNTATTTATATATAGTDGPLAEDDASFDDDSDDQ